VRAGRGRAASIDHPKTRSDPPFSYLSYLQPPSTPSHPSLFSPNPTAPQLANSLLSSTKSLITPSLNKITLLDTKSKPPFCLTLLSLPTIFHFIQPYLNPLCFLHLSITSPPLLPHSLSSEPPRRSSRSIPLHPQPPYKKPKTEYSKNPHQEIT